ncbi:hypothetical protein [Streptomyces sp. NRRL F-5053]|uniref:hypothetical protein n=1 Tax=Streptomyces sp. NRRL F-5053 TaxID=1463854 RepID=UPI0013315797|nr:hypothetical protein [Streptomyces sp. NRRL F-5053]
MGTSNIAAGSRKKERKKKPDELLASVVRETAFPAAIELLRANEKFVFPSGTAWAMLVLAADAVGGLSKRHSRDEAKGSIIELINSDQIKTVASAEMLDAEVFGIIPDDETLARMEEYSLLTSAEYSWAVVWQKSNMDLAIDLVTEATFAQAQAVAAGSMDLKEAVGAATWKEHSGTGDTQDALLEDAPPAHPGPPTEALTTDGDLRADDTHDGVTHDAAFEPVPGEDDENHFDGFADEPVFEEFAGPTEFDDEPVDFGDDDAAQTPLTIEPPGDVESGGFEELDTDDADNGNARAQQNDTVLWSDQDQVRDAIARRFMSEDLDLDVRLDEFNATFAIGAPVVQIEPPRGATEWLGDQMAQLSRQANADLAQLRLTHEDELRTLYVTLMARHVESVIRNVATDREGSRYRALKEAAEASHARRQSEKDQHIRATRAQIASDYEAQAKRLAEQAAIQAEIQAKERNRAQMRRDQADAVAEIDRSIENAYTHDMQEILRVRRSDAALQMQVGTTRVFEVLAERQSEYLAAEQECLDRWKAEIQQLATDNRKADIAQSTALAEHHRTTDEVGNLRREHAARVEALRSKHAERIRELEDELERRRKDAVAAMQTRDAEWQHSLTLEKERTESQAAHVADLLMQVETVDKRHQKTIEDLKTQCESYAAAMARANAMNSRSSKLLVLFMVMAGLIGVSAGWIAGSATG